MAVMKFCVTVTNNITLLAICPSSGVRFSREFLSVTFSKIISEIPGCLCMLEPPFQNHKDGPELGGMTKSFQMSLKRDVNSW